MVNLTERRMMGVDMAGRKRKTTSRKRRKRKLILFIVEIIVLLLLLGGIFVASKLNLMERETFDKDKVQNKDLSKDTQETLSGYTDIAFLGLDNRTSNSYDYGNSDVIIVVSINNDTKEINMVSVYRDTYLDIAEMGAEPKFRKANAAYANGGVDRAITMLNKNLDLDIDDYLVFDFASVADAIDILGGVDIEITDSEVKYMKKYIEHTNGILGTNSPLIYESGMQTLDGVQAVAYSRIRYTAGGDFKRAERQRTVIAAALEKAKKSDLRTLNELVDTVFPEIRTSMSAGTMISMASSMLKYDMGDSYGFPFDRTTMQHRTKGDIVVPCTLETNVIMLHEILYGKEDYEPSQVVQDYSDWIVNDTGKTADKAMNDQFVVDREDDESDETDTAE